MNDHPLCSTCRFFKPDGTHAMSQGECHRRAPSPDYYGKWRSVYPDDWCGEHEPCPPGSSGTPRRLVELVILKETAEGQQGS